MAKSHPTAGQHNLKGKKSKRLSCGCCIVQDFREELQEKDYQWDDFQVAMFIKEHHRRKTA
jgi:hypothetical protein